MLKKDEYIKMEENGRLMCYEVSEYNETEQDLGI